MLGGELFETLGSKLTGTYSIMTDTIQGGKKEYSKVFEEGLDVCNGPQISFALDLIMEPI